MCQIRMDFKELKEGLEKTIKLMGDENKGNIEMERVLIDIGIIKINIERGLRCVWL